LVSPRGTTKAYVSVLMAVFYINQFLLKNEGQS